MVVAGKIHAKAPSLHLTANMSLDLAAVAASAGAV
jgi:hypothetical protein